MTFMSLSDTPFSLFLLLRTTPAWLALSRDERNNIAGQAMNLALSGQAVSLRYFDAEAFSGRCTDLALLSAMDLRACYKVIERLRDSPLFSVPYFEVVDIIPTLEDGFRAFEAEEAA